MAAPYSLSLSRAALIAAVLLGLGGTGLVVSAGFIHAKAAVGQLLLRDAWRRTVAGERQVRPWPWADTWPVARLRAPGHGEDLIVMESASGQALAFGPGHVSETAAPGDPGNSVIGGHRDTSFRFVARLRPGDPLHVQRADGEGVAYRVIATRIVDSRKPWYPARPATGGRLLTLVTCYPFDAVDPGGPMRYLVVAESI